MDTGRILSQIQCELLTRQLPDGGWGFRGSQAALEPTCLALLSLSDSEGSSLAKGLKLLRSSQRSDGSWSAFSGGSEASSLTALALLVLNLAGDQSLACESGVRWLLDTRGQEAHWLWSWKFRIADKHARLNPGKYGWPWINGAASWVIPTAFSLIALKKMFLCGRTKSVQERIRIGTEMLVDRACPEGGWNAGNGVVYGVPLAPHLDTTAIALLALQDEPAKDLVIHSLQFLRKTLPECPTVASLAWGILALSVYSARIPTLIERLSALITHSISNWNTADLAVAAIALRSTQSFNRFQVGILPAHHLTCL